MKIIECFKSIDVLEIRGRLILAEAHRLVGQCFAEIGFYDRSLECYREVLQLIKSLNNAQCLYRAEFDLARSLMLKKNLIEAIEIFKKLFHETETNCERALIVQSMSECFFHRNEFDQAKVYAFQALDHASLANDELLLIEINILLGKIFLQFKDFSRAKEYFLYAQQLKDEIGDFHQWKSIDEYLKLVENEKFNHQSIRSTMKEEKEISNVTKRQWRILTPYCQLFDAFRNEELHRRREKSRTN